MRNRLQTELLDIAPDRSEAICAADQRGEDVAVLGHEML
jgi:hypothetical protein